MKKTLWILVSVLLVWACSGNDNGAPASATRLARKLLIVDTHIDVPYRMEHEYEDVSEATKNGNFDYPRAKQGGLDVAFMSIYVPADLEQTGGSYELANKLIDGVEEMVRHAPDKFALAFSTADVIRNTDAGLILLPMGMENGSPIEGSLEKLDHFYRRGIRYITLTHSENNHISDSSYASEKKWGGLSDFGREVVVAMNALGIMVDVSHLSDEAFYDVIETSGAPVIASHSSARAFTPGFERNMSDEMIKVLAENGGVIQINFGSSFLTREANDWYTHFAAKQEEMGIVDDTDEAEEFTRQYLAENPYPFATLDDVLDHIDHVVELVGVDHVGLGSDFDGVGNSLPVHLKDVSDYPYLVQGLIDRGYDEDAIEKILGGNLMRVWSEVEMIAAKEDRM